MTERVTVEQNGERFTLEVPDGTSDADIQAFLAQQQGSSAAATPSGVESITTPSANAAENVAAQVPIAATGTAKSLLAGAATENARDVLNIAKNATSWTPNAIMDVVSHPLNTAQAYVAGHPWANTPVKQLAGGVGKNILGAIGEGLVSPENLMTLPYNMAAYEQAKIRANPNAPGLESNPYAQVVRGEAPTQAAAGAMNQRQAVKNFATAGNPMPGTPEFAKLQQQYQDEQTLKQPPTDQNFMARMTALSRKYLNTQ